MDTSQHGVLDKLDCRRLGFVAVLVVSKTATRQNGDRHAPFWICRRLGCRRFDLYPVKQHLEFQLDTAATCNMLTRRNVAKRGKPRLTESTQAITMYDDSNVIPDG